MVDQHVGRKPIGALQLYQLCRESKGPEILQKFAARLAAPVRPCFHLPFSVIITVINKM
jgi:hypothetical protein